MATKDTKGGRSQEEEVRSQEEKFGGIESSHQPLSCQPPMRARMGERPSERSLTPK